MNQLHFCSLRLGSSFIIPAPKFWKYFPNHVEHFSETSHKYFFMFDYSVPSHTDVLIVLATSRHQWVPLVTRLQLILSTCGTVFPFYPRPTILLDDHRVHMNDLISLTSSIPLTFTSIYHQPSIPMLTPSIMWKHHKLPSCLFTT